MIEVVQDKPLDMSNWSGLFFIDKGDDLSLAAGKKDKPKNTAARIIELTSACKACIMVVPSTAQA